MLFCQHIVVVFDREKETDVVCACEEREQPWTWVGVRWGDFNIIRDKI